MFRPLQQPYLFDMTRHWCYAALCRPVPSCAVLRRPVPSSAHKAGLVQIELLDREQLELTIVCNAYCRGPIDV